MRTEMQRAKRAEWRHKNPDKVREMARRASAKHRARINATSRRWRLAHPELVRQVQRKCYLKYREKRLADCKEYAKKNKLMVSARKQKWADQNRERVRNNHARWRKQNPDRLREMSQRAKAIRRVKQYSQEVSMQMLKIIGEWELWHTRKAVRCYWCCSNFAPSKCHSDHIIAISIGGKHSIENMCIACSSCNHKKNRKPISKWIAEIQNPILL
jgi:HNH endonuclease